MRAKGRLITAISTILLIVALAVPGAVYAAPDFPQVAAVCGGTTLAGTSHTVYLPAGIAAGDLLLVFVAADGGASATQNITFPNEGTDWFELFKAGRPATGNPELLLGAWYRIADGTEGSHLNVTTTMSRQTAYTSYLITGCYLELEAATANGMSVSPNPPSLTPSWGAADMLWFAACGYDNDTTKSITTYPISYTNGRDENTYNCGLATARRELNAASEDPGPFTLSGAEQWVAATVAIRGAATCELTVQSDGCCPIFVAWDGNSGNVTPGKTGNFTIPCCANVTLTADDSDPYCDFTTWLLDGASPFASVDITVEMCANHTAVATCERTLPPPPVGGTAYPINKLAILAPWIALAVVLAGGAGWYALRRRRPQS